MVQALTGQVECWGDRAAEALPIDSRLGNYLHDERLETGSTDGLFVVLQVPRRGAAAVSRRPARDPARRLRAGRPGSRAMS
jgi:hypothetical protein